MALADDLGAEEYAYLTTRGRRSGRPHTVELWFAPVGTSIWMIAGGGPSADWVANLLAAPAVTVRIGGRTFRGRPWPDASWPRATRAGRRGATSATGPPRPWPWPSISTSDRSPPPTSLVGGGQASPPGGVEGGVGAVALDELVVGAQLHEASVRDHGHAIGALRRAQPVG